MPVDRRGFMGRVGAGFSLIPLSTISTSSDDFWQKHSLEIPEEAWVDPVVGECIDQVEISNDDPPHVWEIPNYADFVDVEMELDDEDVGVDILVVSDYSSTFLGSSRDAYESAITPPESTTISIGGRTFEYTSPIDSARTGIAKTQLNESTFSEATHGFCPIRQGGGDSQVSYSIDGGTHYLVLDPTEAVGGSSVESPVSADISVRARRKPAASVEKEAQDGVGQLYTHAKESGGSYSGFGYDLATTICEISADGFNNLKIDEIRHTGNKTGQLKSLIKALFTYLRDSIGFEPTFLEDVLSTSIRWLKWGMSVAPMLSSAQRMVEAACEVASPSTENVEEKLKEMYLHLGILIADIVFAAYGLAGRMASAGIKLADTYIIGFLKRRMGLKSYLFLLRELHLFLEFSVHDALEEIKRITEGIVKQERRDFFTDEERSTVFSMGVTGLKTLDVGVDSNLSTATTECTNTLF